MNWDLIPVTIFSVSRECPIVIQCFFLCYAALCSNKDTFPRLHFLKLFLFILIGQSHPILTEWQS